MKVLKRRLSRSSGRWVVIEEAEPPSPPEVIVGVGCR
ncbi:uncharacterized protein G2W53_008894 [Senna tora]|uniref:Uncharacterized protein n=1 Tax=Senna tora TaxID=362788 RepID=A0A834WWF4_9FABA|nr:uncharacterized protein G2W53_008894 [Senna tora]